MVLSAIQSTQLTIATVTEAVITLEAISLESLPSTVSLSHHHLAPVNVAQVQEPSRNTTSSVTMLAEPSKSNRWHPADVTNVEVC